MAESSPAALVVATRELWLRLSRAQRLTIASTAVVTVILVVTLVNLGSAPYQTLYEGLTPNDATAVIQQLRLRGVDHRMAEGGSRIEVRGASIEDLRIDLAAEGLPETETSQGFEIFDHTQLGATGFTDDVNLRRAIEGELARTFRRLKEVADARVHVVLPNKRSFGLSKHEAKASVFLQLRPGKHLADRSVHGLQYLVASAVDGLAPSAVAIIDDSGELLSRPPDGEDSGRTEAELAEREKVEAQLGDKVDAILEPLFGSDHFSTRISADLDFSAVEETAELVDPQTRAMISEHLQQDGADSTRAGGVAGTGGNLDAEAARRRGNGPVSSSSTRNWEVSRTVRRVVSPRYRLERLSVAVVIDQAAGSSGGSPDATRIESLLSAAVGLDTDRGDQLEVSYLPFSTVEPEPMAEVSSVDRLLAQASGWARPLGLTLVAILAYLLFLRPLKRQATLALRQAGRRPAALPPANVASLAASSPSAAQLLAAEIDDAQPPGATMSATQMTSRLREQMLERAVVDPAATARTLRGWLSEGQR